MTSDRPRDALGRPLPADADPAFAAEPVVDITGESDALVWVTALAYLDRGLPFHAHEVFEQRWRTCPVADRDAWRALAQWGAALTHEARGNHEGARRLAQRAMEGLAMGQELPLDVDPTVVQESCEMLIRESSDAD